MVMKKTIEEVQEIYDLDLEKVVETIKKENAKKVLLQFPDGLKINSDIVVDYLEEKVKAEFFIWMGTCFGACDLPNVNEKDFDLVVQFGHSKWGYGKKENIKEL